METAERKLYLKSIRDADNRTVTVIDGYAQLPGGYESPVKFQGEASPTTNTVLTLAPDWFSATAMKSSSKSATCYCNGGYTFNIVWKSAYNAIHGVKRGRTTNKLGDSSLD